MDTEFPGVVARPIGEFKSTSDYQYQLLRSTFILTTSIFTTFSSFSPPPVTSIFATSLHHVLLLRCNVDLLKIIQLGLTFFNAEGEMPEGVCTWQFNFKVANRIS